MKMKTNLAILLFGLLVGRAAAQEPYHPLIQPNKTWDEYYTILPSICYSWGDRVFFADRDTVVNGLTYKICLSQPLIQVYPGPFCPPFNVDSTAYFAVLMREDTLTRRVYINCAQTGGLDDLLYDFSLSPGDTLHSDYLGYGETIVIQAIEYETLNNGETRKKFVISPMLNSAYIEGIGGTYGMFAQMPVSFCECAGGYFCVKKDGVNLMGSGGNCNFPYVGQNEKVIKEVKVTPNPVRDMVTVTVPAIAEGSVFELINISGALCFSVILTGETSVFDLSGLPAGIYGYRIGGNLPQRTGKLVKISR